MKKITFFLMSFMALGMSRSLFSQSNSVQLKDGVGTLISSHTSITQAYGAIPASISQAYIIELTATYTGSAETYPITFVAKTGASSSNTITLRPELGTVSTIQSTVSGGNILTLNDADYVIIDGRAGGVGTSKALTISNTGTSSSSNTITFINGATHNQVKYCNVLNSTTSNAGRNINISTSTNTSGNSDNTISYCYFPNGRYQFSLLGTAGSPNARNHIFGCEFVNLKFVGVWIQANTGKLTIDSCSFYCTTASGDGAFYGILSDSQLDTLIVRNNRMYDFQGASAGAFRYVHMRSVAVGSNNYLDVYNNFMSLTTANASHPNIGVIEIAGSNPSYARIVHNSIRIGGTLSSGGTSGNIGSFGVLLANSSPLSTFTVRNNIIVNDRTGGNVGLQHLSLAVTNTGPSVTLNDNTYNSSSGNFARNGTTVYTDLTAYQSALAPNESNSNLEPVTFVSNTDLHLSGMSLGNPNLLGMGIADITTDIDNNLRSLTPYRGAHEGLPPVIGCSGTPTSGNAISNANSVCSGGSVTLNLTGLSPGEIPVLTFQWQSSTDGVIFTDIIGATSQSYSTTITQLTHFRAVVTCTSSSQSANSGIVTVGITPTPSVTSIAETHNVAQFNFSVNGSQNVTGYSWNFGDGNTGSGANPTHTYTNGGTYTVTLTASNACGTTTSTLQVYVGCEGTPPAGFLSSSLTTVCAGQNFTVTLSGISSIIAPTLTYQWQSSSDNINFTNIAGETASTLSISGITATTYYRVVITCTSSGLSTNSNSHTINFLPLPTVVSISETHTGATYQFTANGLQNANATLWNFGNGTLQTGFNPTYVYPSGGNFTVTVVASNGCGTDTATLAISVGCTTAPSVAQVQSSLDSVCIGDAFTLSLAGLNANDVPFYTYQWQSSIDGISFTNIVGATAVTLNATAGSNSYFRCVVTCPNGNSSTTSQVKEIHIGQSLSAVNIVHQANGLTHTFSVTGVTNYTVNWDFGDGNTSSDLAPVHTYQNNGTYTVTASVSNACGTQTFTINVTLNVNIDEVIANDLGLVVYPNPTRDIVNLNVVGNSLASELTRVSIKDLTGKSIWTRNNNMSLPLTLSATDMGLVIGTYLLEVDSNGRKAVFRIIIQ